MVSLLVKFFSAIGSEQTASPQEFAIEKNIFILFYLHVADCLFEKPRPGLLPKYISGTPPVQREKHKVGEGTDEIHSQN